MSDMKSGRKSGISVPTAKKIAAYFDVPVEYLLTGEYKEITLFEGIGTSADQRMLDVAMHISGQKNNAPGEITLTEDEKSLIELFRKVPPERRAFVVATIRAAIDNL
jgi:hypothetical protein